MDPYALTSKEEDAEMKIALHEAQFEIKDFSVPMNKTKTNAPSMMNIEQTTIYVASMLVLVETFHRRAHVENAQLKSQGISLFDNIPKSVEKLNIVSSCASKNHLNFKKIVYI